MPPVDPFPHVAGDRPTPPVVSVGSAAALADLWDQELRAARRRLEPDGALTGATRELQGALGTFLTTCHEHGVKVGPWRLQHVVPEWPFGDHPTYGAVTLAHWACKDGQPWRVAVGLFLARGAGKPKDLEVKLGVMDVAPQVVDHLILLRPEDDLSLSGKSKQLWQEAERRGKHARLEPISLDGFAQLSSFPRWLAAVRESLPEGSPLPNLADLIQEKAEALRLDPSSEWARHGMIEALKARYWLYRQMLRFFLWMSRLSRQAQWGLILGLIVAQQVLVQVGRANPVLRPLTTPLLLALLAFVILTWVAEPLFNLLLRLNRFGRFALDRDQRRQSHWVGGVLLVGLLALGYGVVAPGDYDVPGWTTAFGCLLLLMPVSAVFRVPTGWPRWVMVLYSLGMAGMIVATIGCFYDALTATSPEGAEEMAGAGFALFRYTIWAGFLSGLLANGLMMVRQRQ